MIKVRKLVLTLLLLSSAIAQAEYDGKYWTVRQGDTLYAIARSFYPDNAKQQAILRRDIIRLNQNVFAAGKNNLFIGLRLHLPGYVTSITTTQKQPVQKRTPPLPLTKPLAEDKSSKLVAKAEWRIKRGDTLYSIGRYFFPKSNREQHRLRTDIQRLNPGVFINGGGRLEVGMILKLPEYLVEKQQKSQIVVPVTPLQQSAQPVRPANQESKRPQPVESEIIQKSKVLSNPQPKPEAVEEIDSVSLSSRATTYATASDYEDAYSLSIGYSVGGDTALIVTGGNDVTFGSGVHLRFNYDGLWSNSHGLRVGLGTQIDMVTAGNDSGELAQNYLQLLYLYNADSVLLGLGVSYHTGVVLESDIGGTVTTVEPDDSLGMTLAIEYKRFLGSNIIGFAHTTVEADLQGSTTPVDMSRTEFYYRWQF